MANLREFYEKVTGQGHYETRTNYEVQSRINEITNNIRDYNSLKSQISSLATTLDECSMNLANSYRAASDALKIGDASFNDNMLKIQNVSNNMKSAAENLRNLIATINSEISSLESEKASLEPKVTYQVWVSDRNV